MLNHTRRAAACSGIVALSLFAAACGSSSKSSSNTTGASTSVSGSTTSVSATTPSTTAGAPTGTTVDPTALKATLNGSGSTFVKAFVQASSAAFTKKATGVTINYPGGGSGKGRQDLADQLVQFAGSDSPIPAADIAKFKGGAVLYFPVVVAPITLSFHVDGVDKLQLSPDTIAKIFQAQITTWNDPAIAADNTGVTLPATHIVVVHRSDSSGTTANFTLFLDKASGASGSGVWTLKNGSTVQWPTDSQAGSGNAGVAQIVKSTNGAIGYVDYSDAKAAGFKFASVKNKAGNFVAPTLDAASAAAGGITVNADLTFTSAWADGATAYPVTAQTFMLVYATQTDKAVGQALKGFLAYMLTDGQTLAPTVDFAALPGDLASKAIAQLDKIQMPA